MNRMAIIFALLAGLAITPPVAAQSVDTAPLAEATKQGKDVDIEADSMEVLDKQRKAIFTGKVSASRGSVRLKSDRLVVDYRTGAKTGQSQGGSTEISHLEATGNVTITTRTQKITGNKALMDVKANKLTVEGNVVVEQGTSVVKGNQLVVDLASSRSQMTGGRVKGSFAPGQTGQ